MYENEINLSDLNSIKSYLERNSVDLYALAQMLVPVKDNYTRRSWVRRIVDGDTLEVMVDGGYYRYSVERVRLLRVNTPEIRGEEKVFGLVSKAYVEKKLPIGVEVQIVSQKGDAFGRWLAEVYFIDTDGKQANLSGELLKEGLAVPFKG
jgi:micrococcal nuclease